MRGWQRVRVTVKCIFGCEIKHGEWALLLSQRGSGVCEAHALEHYKLERVLTAPRSDGEDANA